MRNPRPLLAVLLCGAAAHAQELQPLIDRPVTQPRGAVELTAHGTYTNWDARAFVGPGTGSLTGETLALGADFGATDLVELGLATALPINPGAAFGSILGSAAFAVDKAIALRVDAGFENFGVNGDNTGGSSHISRYFAGLGARIKVPISPNIAFVTGRTGAIHFGHFNNVGFSGVGLYNGASRLTEASSDVLVLSGGGDNSGTNIGINLPAGLLLQPDPHVAFTLQAGYSAVIEIPSSGSSAAAHFIPLGLEAVVTPTPPLDIGARFFLDGYVATTGSNVSNGPRYFDLRALMFWLRFRV